MSWVRGDEGPRRTTKETPVPSPIEIDLRSYASNIRVTAESTMPLARRIHKALPDDATPVQTRYCREVVLAAELVQRVKSERDRLAPEKLRPIKLAFQNDWGALHDTLGGMSRVRVGDRGARAAKLLQTLFTDGLAFTLLEADEAWSEAKRRLDRIDAESLEDELTAVVGAEVLEGAKLGTRELAEAIGVGRGTRELASPNGLQAALAEFGRAVGQYMRSLLADVDERDPATVHRFIKAVGAVDLYRSTPTRAPQSETPPPRDGAPTNGGGETPAT
ncbi:hypothetical protein [Sandaracinus amylolyticus]|uniref:Uncharacterized protein n=1 Tax=Sandaracinus amylolyticus TaxID=927083 RepID=A0A0F6SF29_9BACT|nr:hypothetical protein [Sandaracinus amylolyticus]AKF06224.1 hypothetical protein DB32_003373 [Sandaracinus amylolyticus]